MAIFVNGLRDFSKKDTKRRLRWRKPARGELELPLDLTVDVGILMSGSGLGDLAHQVWSLALMKGIESKPDWLLALDKRGRIRYQYEERVKQGFGRDWLRRLATRGRIVLIPWQRLNRGVVTALKEAHFDKEDFKYVETAAVTVCKVLVSHDPDYTDGVRSVLKRIPVHVAAASELPA